MLVSILVTVPAMASLLENTESIYSSVKCNQTWLHMCYSNYLKFLDGKDIWTHSFEPTLAM